MKLRKLGQRSGARDQNRKSPQSREKFPHQSRDLRVEHTPVQHAALTQSHIHAQPQPRHRHIPALGLRAPPVQLRGPDVRHHELRPIHHSNAQAVAAPPNQDVMRQRQGEELEAHLRRHGARHLAHRHDATGIAGRQRQRRGLDQDAENVREIHHVAHAVAGIEHFHQFPPEKSVGIPEAAPHAVKVQHEFLVLPIPRQREGQLQVGSVEDADGFEVVLHVVADAGELGLCVEVGAEAAHDAEQAQQRVPVEEEIFDDFFRGERGVVGESAIGGGGGGWGLEGDSGEGDVGVEGGRRVGVKFADPPEDAGPDLGMSDSDREG